MTDTLRTRIAAVIHRELSQPCCDECPDWGPEPWEIVLADAVIRELKLEALELLARSWYRNYDTIPANDPRCPTDMDIAYDDAGEQILTALGLLHD